MLRKSLGLTATVVITLALGIGATTAIYTVVYATLLAPMPYPQPDQLVMVWSKIQGFRNGDCGRRLYRLEESEQVVSGFERMDRRAASTSRQGAAGIGEGQKTTPGMYRMMGIQFILGRDFLPEEGVAGKDHVVILMNKMWRRLGSDPHIIGKQITDGSERSTPWWAYLLPDRPTA